MSRNGPVLLGQAIRNTSSANVPSVIREIEIWRVAVLMINRYADEAEANSFRRAGERGAEGDHAGAAIWRRVTTDTTGPADCKCAEGNTGLSSDQSEARRTTVRRSSQ